MFTQMFAMAIRSPSDLFANLKDLELKTCFRFGWFCLFVATLSSAGFQAVFSAEMLQLFQSDPSSANEMTQMLGAIGAKPGVDLVGRLESVRLANYFSLVLSPLSSWIFLYLISGALFFLTRLLTFNGASQDKYEHLVKIVAVGQAPLLFCVIPFIGPIVGNLWTIWLITKGLGSLFQINVLGRLSIVAFSFLFLFSIWNSTLATLADAYRAKINAKTEVTSWTRS